MYLKRLEIHGFKSFASRTVFEFGTGITTVVGPNGSGKSNVSDALRWVLGEQSTRSLRARKTEDVIFAGSGKRNQMGMAEVAITLDNAEGWLPIDFREVVVSRRAFRSGENEYLINGAKVRLRDVLDLFQRANVGQNSYAFMGQGMVDSVLSLRPEDRRGLIEEAADVRRHQVKLDEARARLTATLENMQRAGMLVAEIAPRLNQLERQARRADEHARLSEELAAALQALFGGQWEVGQEALVAARAAHDQEARAFQAAEAAFERTKAGLAEVRDQVTALRREAATREAERARLTHDLTRLEQSIALDRERHSMISTRRDELQAEIQSLEDELTQSSGPGGSDEGRDAALASAIAAARTRLADENAALAALEREFAEHRHTAAQADEVVTRVRITASEAKQKAGRLEQQIARLLSDQEALANRIRTQSVTMTEAAAQLRSHRDAEAALVSEMEAAAAEHDALQATALKAQERVEAVREEATRLEREQEMLVAREELLAQFAAEQQGSDAGVRAIFDLADFSSTRSATAPDLPPIRGVVGVVSRLLRVPSGLEKAIEAALAENLTAVVIESQHEALSALHMLVTQKAGRAFVVPNDALKHTYPINLHKERGVVGVASALVRFDNAHRPLFETLLGRTVVVQDVEAAEMIVRRGLGNAVTLEGILFRQNGTLYGGVSEGSVATAFGRDQELADVRERIAALEGGRVGVQARLNTALDGVETANTAAARSFARVDTLEQREVEIRRGIDAAQSAIGPLRSELQWSSAAVQRANEELAELRASQSAITAEGEAESARIADLQRVAEERRLGLADFDHRRSAVIQRVAEASAAVSAAESELRAIAMMREKEEAALRRLSDSIAAKRAQSRNLELEANALAGRVETAQRELGALTASLAATNEGLAPQAESLRRLEAAERERDAEIGPAQSARLESERRLLEAEAEARRRSEELDTLLRTMEGEGYTVSDAGRVVPLGQQFDDMPDWLLTEVPAGGGDLPPIAGAAEVDVDALQRRITSIRGQIRNLGPVNSEAPADYHSSKERHEFLTTQLADLAAAEAELRGVIAELQELVKVAFTETFAKVNASFSEYFSGFFGGGQASLELVDADALNGGVEIIAQPPGKRLQSLSMLSGGERALTAISLLFALLSNNPSPVCVMDEVDAALDEANVTRFAETLGRLAERTQFVVVTHNRRTIEKADAIYGVSMSDDSTSKVLSLRLSDVTRN